MADPCPSTVSGAPREPSGHGDPSFLPGELVADRFQVQGLTGRGGTGEVYQAWDLILGQRVALKVLQPEDPRSPRDFHRARRELLLARRVTHRNVCRVHDAVIHPSNGDSKSLVVTMELLDGPTLEAWLRQRGPLDPGEALPWIRQLAGALDAAHEAGVLHLDLKPANIVLVHQRDPPGHRPVVTDFGLARPLTAQGDPSRGGTRGYMAPEQEAGEEVGKAADIYGFGAVIHRMLTGAAPGGEPDALQPGSGKPGFTNLEPPIRRVLERALSRQPRERFPDARSLADALAVPPADPAPPPPPALLARLRNARYFPAGRIAASLLTMATLLAFAALTVAGFGGEREVPERSLGAGSTASPLAGAPTRESTAEQQVPRRIRRVVEGAQENLRRLDAAAAAELLEPLGREARGWAPYHGALSDALWILGRDGESREQARLALEAATDLPRMDRLTYEARWRARRFDWRTAARLYDAVWTHGPAPVDVGIELTRALHRAGEPARAAEVLGELRRRPASSEDPRMDLLAGSLLKATDQEEVLLRARRALDLVEELEAPLLQAEALRLAGDTLRNLGRPEEGRRAIESARDIYRERDNPSLEGVSNRALARISAILGEDEDARRLFRSNIEIQRRVGSERRLPTALHSLATFEIKRGRSDVAAPLLEEAHELFRSLGDLERLAPVVQSRAVLALNLGDVDTARELLEETLELNRRLGRKRGQALVLNNLAEIYFSSGQVLRAEEALLEALELAQEIHDHEIEHVVHASLAQLTWALGDLDRARAHAEEIVDAENLNPVISAYGHFFAGQVARTEGRPALAEPAYLRAVELAEAVAASVLADWFRSELAWLWSGTGQHRRATAAAREAWEGVRASGEALYIEQTAAVAIETHLTAGQPGRAREILEEVQTIYPDWRPSVGSLRLAVAAGRLSVAEGDLAEGREILLSSLERPAHDDSLALELWTLALLARVEGGLGRFEEAARLLQRRREIARAHGFSVPLRAELTSDLPPKPVRPEAPAS